MKPGEIIDPELRPNQELLFELTQKLIEIALG